MDKFKNVSVEIKSNVYFDGKVVSRAVFFEDGTRKTLGIIFPGSFSFDTAAPELMQITAGSCKVKLKGETEWKTYSAGTEFNVPENSAFDISVEDGIAEYICSYC